MKWILEGRCEGKRGRGRRRKEMLDDLKNGRYDTLKRVAQDCEAWRIHYN